MEESLLGLENIIDQEELLEPNPEQEALIQDSYDIEFEEKYLLDTKLFEVQDAVNEFHELHPRDIEDHYFIDDQRLEIHDAVSKIHEKP